MQPYQERVVEEYHELSLKIEKLEEFNNGNFFKSLENVDKNLLVEQLFHMKDYRDILELRINRFNATAD